MKKSFLAIILSLVLVLSLGLAACTPTGPQGGGGGNTDTDLTGTYDITVWVSETALEDGRSVKALTEQQIAAFNAANPGIVINATVEGVSEADAATQMISDVESGADIFCFAQDQLARLVMAGALNPLGKKASADVTEANDASAVKAATVNGQIYCYPLTSDNGYFMYYDKSVIQESSIDDLTALIADCKAAGRGFSMEIENSAWYNAAWFFATGCTSTWETNDSGAFVAVNDNFNSDAGVIALRGMQELLSYELHVESSKAADFAAAIPSAIVITGTWDSATAKANLGENYAVADLPSFTVDGKSYHLGSYSGNKLLGVKPQIDAKRAAVLQKLAVYLTGESCQLDRFNEFGWGPSNVAAQANDAVKADEALTALAQQSAYAYPQGQIQGQWWDIAKTYATAAKKAARDDVDALKAALVAYEEAILGTLSMSEEAKLAYGVVGGFENNGWGANDAESDVAMEQKPEGTYYTKRPINFKTGDEFKVRQGKGWDVQWGDNASNAADPGSTNKANYKVTEADGWYFVKLVIVDGVGTVSLEKTNPNIGWSVIGSIAGDTWTKDIDMEIIDNENGSVWMSKPIEFVGGEEFKVRQGHSWDVDYGADLDDYGFNKKGGANHKVTEAGTYQIKLTIDVSGKAKVEVVPVA